MQKKTRNVVLLLVIVILMSVVAGCKDVTEKSGDADLTEITVKADGKDIKISPDFSRTIMIYTASIPATVTSVSISAATANDKAGIVSGTGEIIVEGNSKKIDISVKAEDDTKKNYTITINKENNKITAAAISITGASIVEEGKEIILEATAKMSDNSITNSGITWNSSDIEAATVKNGVVKGLKAGAVTISAIYGNITTTKSITVIPVKKEIITLTAISINAARVLPTGNVDARVLEIGADFLAANGIVDSMNNGNIFVVRGDFDNWTSFNGAWFEVSPNDVKLKEENGKLILNSEDIIKRASAVPKIPLWSDSVKIVAFDKTGKFIAEQRENKTINTFVTEKSSVADVEIIFDNSIKTTGSNGEYLIDITGIDVNKTLKLIKKGYFYKEVSIKEIKEKPEIIISKLNGSLTGDIRYMVIDGPEILGGKRNITVYLPPDYEKNSDKRYPVIYIHDGKSAFDSSNYIGEEMSIDETLEKMYVDKKGDGFIAVAIDENQNRNSEYVPWDWSSYKGLGNEYLEFIKTDVKGYIDSKYRTKTDAENTFLTGCSLGGLISLYAIVKNGDTFGKIIAFSSSIDINNFQLEKELKTSVRIGKAKVFYDAIKFEIGSNTTQFTQIADTLKTIGFKSTDIKMNIENTGSHSPNSWGMRFPAALEWIINEVPTLPATQIEVQTSKNEIISDGVDSVTFSAILKDSDGNIKENESVVYKINGIITTKTSIRANEAGEIILEAALGNLKSITTLKAIEIAGINTQIQKNDLKLVSSSALAVNMVGQSGKKNITVIVPPSYSISQRKYPVIYALAGFGESSSEYMGEFGATSLWNMMKTQQIKESIMVVIDGWSGVSSSFYANSKVLGNWEEFIAKDVVEFVDANYRTIPDSNSRGIMGYATGGTGAFNISVKYPKIFSVVYCFNPGIADSNGVKEYIIGSDSEIRATITLLNSYKNITTREIITNMNKLGTYSAMNIRLCYGLSFAAMEEKPLTQFPYTLENDKIVVNEEIYKRWQNGFGGIEDKIANYKDNMLKLKGLAIEYGIGEENKFIVNGCEYYYKKLTENGIPCILNKNSGGHYNYSLMAKRHAEVVMPYFDKILNRNVTK